MTTSRIYWELRDNGGRRSGTDRRYFSYSSHIPERRRGEDRRAPMDRRSGVESSLIKQWLLGKRDGNKEGIDRRSMWN